MCVEAYKQCNYDNKKEYLTSKSLLTYKKPISYRVFINSLGETPFLLNSFISIMLIFTVVLRIHVYFGDLWRNLWFTYMVLQNPCSINIINNDIMNKNFRTTWMQFVKSNMFIKMSIKSLILSIQNISKDNI